MISGTSTLRLGTIALTLPILLTEFIYSPGRGLSLIPPGEWWSTPTWILEISGLGSMMAGAIITKDRRASSLLLGIGLVFRAIFELRISLLKYLWPLEGLTASDFASIAFNYLGAFLLPGLLWFDLRKISKHKAKNGRISTTIATF